MTKKEIIEKYYIETIETVLGAQYQDFKGEELIQIILIENEKTKDKLLESIGIDPNYNIEPNE